MPLVTGEITSATQPTDPAIPAATRVSLNNPADADPASAPAKPAPTAAERQRQRVDQFNGNDKKPLAADRELTPAASGTIRDAYRSEPAPLRALPNTQAKAPDLDLPSKPFVADVTPKTAALRTSDPIAISEPVTPFSTPATAMTTTTSEQPAPLPVLDPALDPQARVLMPTEHLPLGEMDTDDAARYFAHLDTAFADIDAHRGVMHGPMQWPQPDTPAGQERVETLVSKLFKPKERPESAYTTLVLYMPAPGDPKRLDKITGFATATSRQLRVMVEQGIIPLATATVLHQSLARHAAAGSHPKDAQTITRMFERKRLEVVGVKASPR